MVVFLVPATTLGTIGPVVAKMALGEGRRVGSTMGSLYAWAAVGSIFGTFLTGFVLIDAFGSRAIVSGVAVLLALIGLALAATQYRAGGAFLSTWLAFMVPFNLGGLRSLGFHPGARRGS